MILISLTDGEANRVRYALLELANRRHEQSVDSGRIDAEVDAHEATRLRELAKRFSANNKEGK